MDSIGYIAIVPAQRTCTPDRHTFLTTLIPPRADQLCECGAKTWWQACGDKTWWQQDDEELDRLRKWNEAASETKG
jgi:hypothetical protein